MSEGERMDLLAKLLRERDTRSAWWPTPVQEETEECDART